MKYTHGVFKEFNDLVNYTHNTIHLKWNTSSFDLNTLSVKYMGFDYVGFTF